MSPIFNYTKTIERSQVIPCERTENDGRSVIRKLRVAARDLKHAPKMTKNLTFLLHNKNMNFVHYV